MSEARRDRLEIEDFSTKSGYWLPDDERVEWLIEEVKRLRAIADRYLTEERDQDSNPDQQLPGLDRRQGS